MVGLNNGTIMLDYVQYCQEAKHRYVRVSFGTVRLKDELKSSFMSFIADLVFIMPPYTHLK